MSNPFIEDTCSDSTDTEVDNVNKADKHHLSFDIIASKLLQDGYLLTALELHTELIEHGRESLKLRDFFSNPAQFENNAETPFSPKTLPIQFRRSPSTQTFESASLDRISDDPERNAEDKIAVLEFELRESQKIIQSLRGQLTKAADNPRPDPVGKADEDVSIGSGETVHDSENALRPFEKRALNFLINEYLIQTGYRITSVTFADENETQVKDFDVWDDVGLNTPKPPDLLHLYRDYGQHIVPIKSSTDALCEADILKQSDFDQQQSRVCGLEQIIETKEAEFSERISELNDEITRLVEANNDLEKQLTTARRLRPVVTASPAVLSPNDSRRVVAEVKPRIDRQELQLKSRDSDERHTRSLSMGASSAHNVPSFEMPSVTETELHPDQLNITVNIDSADQISHGDSAPTSLDTPSISVEEIDPYKALCKHYGWVAATERQLSAPFLIKLHSAAYENMFELSSDTFLSRDEHVVLSQQTVIDLLAKSLPYLQPNRNDDIRPMINLIVCAACLHNDPALRDSCLSLLFNVVKKPDELQRAAMLRGCVQATQYMGSELASSELLPHIWEALGSRFFEKRMLVASTCGVLAPYLQSEIRGSLLLSILQQLTSDRNPDVRRQAVIAVAVLSCWIDDQDKFRQLHQVLMTGLADTDPTVCEPTKAFLMPVLANWAVYLNTFEEAMWTHFWERLQTILASLQEEEDAINIENDVTQMCSYLRALVPYFAISLITTCPRVSSAKIQRTEFDVSAFPFTQTSSETLLDIDVILGSEDIFNQCRAEFDTYISRDWFEPWDAYNHFSITLLPDALQMLRDLPLRENIISELLCFFQNLFLSLGFTCVYRKIKPKFDFLFPSASDVVSSADNEIPQSKLVSLSSALVPIYVCCVIPASFEDINTANEKIIDFFTFSLKLLSNTQQKSGISLNALKSAAQGLISINKHVYTQLLIAFSLGVLSANENTDVLLCEHVLVALATFIDCLVPKLSEQHVVNNIVPIITALLDRSSHYVRVAVIPVLGSVCEAVSDKTTLDLIYKHITVLMDNVMDQNEELEIYQQLLLMFALTSPNTEPRFREEVMLPRLTVLAASTNQSQDNQRKSILAPLLFNAYSALSCCFVPDHLIASCLLPGLRCLRSDLAHLGLSDMEITTCAMFDEFSKKCPVLSPAASATNIQVQQLTLTTQSQPAAVALDTRDSDNQTANDPANSSSSVAQSSAVAASAAEAKPVTMRDINKATSIVNSQFTEIPEEIVAGTEHPSAASSGSRGFMNRFHNLASSSRQAAHASNVTASKLIGAFKSRGRQSSP